MEAAIYSGLNYYQPVWFIEHNAIYNGVVVGVKGSATKFHSEIDVDVECTFGELANVFTVNRERLFTSEQDLKNWILKQFDKIETNPETAQT